MRVYALIAVLKRLQDADLVLTLYFQAWVNLNCVYAQHLNKLSDDIMPDSSKRPESWSRAARLSPAELSGSGFWHSKRVTPLSARRSHNAQYRTSTGRTKNAKRANITRQPEKPEIWDNIQENLYPVPENPAENLESYVPTNLKGLPGNPPKKRQRNDFAAVYADESLEPLEQVEFIDYRAKKPVESTYVDSYAPVKTYEKYSRQEAG